MSNKPRIWKETKMYGRVLRCNLDSPEPYHNDLIRVPHTEQELEELEDPKLAATIRANGGDLEDLISDARCDIREITTEVGLGNIHKFLIVAQTKDGHACLTIVEEEN